MKEIIFLLLLWHLQSGSAGFNTPGKLWTTGQDGETQTSDSTPPLTTIAGSPHPEIQAVQVNVSQGPAFASSGNTTGMKAVKKPSDPITSTPASQTNGHSGGGSDTDKMGSSWNSKGTSLESDVRQVLLQQDTSARQDPVTGNRSPKESSLSTGTTSTQQDATSKPSGFETTRRKNWCAYVHTRLLPTVVVDNLETFSSARAKPCTWQLGSCAQRSQTSTQQAYRIKHKIVTRLEWKCCPGYSGQSCQPRAQEQGSLMHSNQAESSTTVGERTLGAAQDPDGPALTQKLNEKISSQEMKLTFLQKKVDNIAAAMNDVTKMLLSLEGKINEDKGRDFQSFLKGLKSRSINELVKGIVREHFKVFQDEMQENVAQIFKTVSSLSEDLENTKESVKHLNETQQKFAQEMDNGPTKLDILELKSHMAQMKEEMTLTCDKPMKTLQEKQRSLEDNLQHQQSRSVIYYESLNRTLTEMKDAHEQLLAAEQSSSQNIPSADKVTESNVTEYMVALHEAVKKHGMMVLQIYDDLRVQDSKISNLSVALEIQRDSVLGVCDDMLSESRRDFQTQLAATQENMLVLNKSLSELLLPLDNKVDKMNEQINDLCYDMEILQPLIEQGVPFSLTSEYEQQIKAEEINEKLENLTTSINRMSSVIKELSKTQEGLKNESQAYQELFESHVNECSMEIEDGLNKTMIVLNSAIDSIQDNYVLKDTLHLLRNETEVCCGRAEKLSSLLAFIPQFQQLNESLQTLLLRNKHEFTSQVVPSLSDLPYDESDKIILHNFRRLFYILNDTSLKVDNQKQDIGNLEEKLLDSLEESKDHEVRLLNVESKISKFLANNCVSLKKNKAASTEKEQMVSLQLQTLSSRIKALEAQSIRFSNTIPVLNKTAHEAWGLCQETNSSIQKVNASIPVLIKLAQPDVPLLQRGLQELVESVLEIKAGTILTNLTQHVDISVASAMNNITKSQKQVKPVLKKSAPVKKGAANVTVSLASRSQRNVDNAIDSEQYSACVSAPCRNGGTCINDRQGFVCACRHPFGGVNCSTKLVDDNSLSVDFSRGSYRYAPMVAFFASHTYGMTTPGTIKFNNLDVNYGASFAPATGKFHVPYLGVYVFEYTIESFSPRASGYLVVDGVDKLTFQAENINSNKYTDRVIAGNALLELNYGQEVWLRLATGSIPTKYPPVTTFSGYLLYRT
ncbi:multimerin-1 [Patagioenas fasciata monilis]|uniref:Multimerin-1 n=1 Tax=Patagioenas fasciata monilis TaxID=372326 RepID=A0A1V4JTX0_PATFA|nr:multimerin-1 [Patagioenas fasciata monilis]